MSMTHGNGRSDDSVPPRPPSAQSAHSSHSSGSGSSKHVKCIGRYVLTGHTLGKGNFARVEAAVHTLTRAKVAVKIIETDKIKEDYVRKNLLREAQLMRRLRHPNIIRLYETMKTNNLYCLVTEIAEGGELLSHVRSDFKEKRLSEATSRPFIRQLVSALHHLHSVGIVHRDLKMENILLDKKKRNVKIVDFGLSNAQKPGSLLQTHCGSPEYAAPELFIPGREYGPEVDVWSLGVNMYAMLVGKLPFRSPRQGTKRRQKLLEQISAGLVESHEKEMQHISIEARNLIGRFLQPEPRKRIRLEEAMSHPWVTKDGSQPLLPYRHTPPDGITTHVVIELMSTVLEVSQSEIKETVRRDRCDWLAAIYNLLIDQPEGRNIIQQLVTDDPEDQLVDAAHYQGSTEHLRLSQADTLDQLPPPNPTQGSGTTGQAAGNRTAYRHAMSTTFEPAAGDYDTATLPLTKKEKRRHHSHREMRPLGAPKTPLNPVQPPPSMRRASVSTPYASPEQMQVPIQGGPAHHGGRKLPVTPSEDPFNYTHYQRQHNEPPRPHSRAESAPDPLPLPPKFAKRGQLARLPTSGSHPVHSPNASEVHSPHASQTHQPYSNQLQSPYASQVNSPHASQMNSLYTSQVHSPHASQVNSPYTSQVHSPHASQVNSPYASQVHPTHPTSPYTGQVQSYQNHSPHASQPHSPYSSQLPSPYASQVHSPSGSPPPSARALSPVSRYPDRGEQNPGYKEPLVSPLSHLGKSAKKKKKAGGLNPIRPRSVSQSSGRGLSASIDAHLQIKTNQPAAKNFGSLKNRSQVAQRKLSVDGAASLGWASSSHFTASAQRKHPPADVKALMQMKLPISPYSSVQDIPRQIQTADIEGGSLTSIDFRHEYFNDPHSETASAAMPNGLSPQASRTIVRSVENLKVDPITGEVLTHKSHHHGRHSRSISAKPGTRPHTLHDGMPELSTSYNRMDDRQLRNGSVHMNHKQAASQERELPRVRDQKGSLQAATSPGGRRKNSLGGFLEKTFKLKNSRDKSASQTLHSKPL